MSIFVIFHYGLDYNDETYEIGGEGANVLREGYKTLGEAKGMLRIRMREELKNFGINDFGYEASYQYPEAAEWLEELTNSDHHYCPSAWSRQTSCKSEHDWNAFINYCIANDIEWLNKVPQLLCIQEITV